MTVDEADVRLAKLQREGAPRESIDDARWARDETVRMMVGEKALRRLDEMVERCVAMGDEEGTVS